MILTSGISISGLSGRFNNLHLEEDECICTYKCDGKCVIEEERNIIYSAKCETFLTGPGPEKEDDIVIHEQPLEIKYCPGMEVHLPVYHHVRYKPSISRKPDDAFIFGRDTMLEDKEMIKEDTMLEVVEPGGQEERVTGGGSRYEDPPYHGTQAIPGPTNPTILEKEVEGGEELGIPGAGGIETISDVGERRGRGKSSTRGEQPTVVPGGGYLPGSTLGKD